MKILLPILILFSCGYLRASVTNTIACTYTAVTNALLTVGEGDEINVQAGTFTWSNSVTLSGGKSFALRGAGTNLTHIVSAAINMPLWIQKTSSTGITTVSDFELVPSASNNPDGFIVCGGNSFNGSGPIRFTRIYATNITTRLFAVGNGGQPTLFDHCWFETAGDTQFNVWRFEGDQDNSYTNASPLGTTNVICVEDCYVKTGPFKGNGFWDSYSGSQVVIRRSFFDGQAVSGTHGYDSGDTSPRTFEYYNNVFTNGQSGSPMFEFRGGTGIVCSNNYYGWQEVAELACFRCCLSDHTSTTHGQLDGSTTNALDGNIDGTGYPGHQQIGVIRSFAVANYVANGVAINYQELLPVYQWQNVLNATNANFILQGPYACGNQITNIIKLNRDYYNGTISPGWQPLVYPHPLVTMAAGSGGGGSSSTTNRVSVGGNVSFGRVSF